MGDFDYSKRSDESVSEYIDRILIAKVSGEIPYSWKRISSIICDEVGILKSDTTWRRKAKKFSFEVTTEETEETVDIIRDVILEYKKERVKLSDERIQNNVYVRNLSREETLKEIAHDVAQTISSKKLLPVSKVNSKKGENSAILQLSDWHYGIEVDTYWNKYNTDVCKQRVSKLLEETISFCKLFKVSTLHVLNLGDLICGRIHETLRLQSRIDVITQTIEVSEILAEFINAIRCQGIEVHYYDCLDNHSRLEPKKQNSIDLESLVRIIPWYLKERFQDKSNITIHTNNYDDDIIDATIDKYRVAGVHGHKHRPSNVVERLTLMTREMFNLVCTAHLHHFSCDERNSVVVVSNGSLMGTDYYAKDLSLDSKPSQNIVLTNKYSVVDYIHRIVLD